MDTLGLAMLSFVGIEVVLFLEVQNVLVLWERYFEECPLERGCPFLRGSFIRGSTVATFPDSSGETQSTQSTVDHYSEGSVF